MQDAAQEMCDLRPYFENLDHEVLKAQDRRKLKDRALLSLLDRIVDCPFPACSPARDCPSGT